MLGLCWLSLVSSPVVAQQDQPGKGIVFLVSETADPTVAASLQEAIGAQLSDVQVRLVFEVGATRSPGMRELIDTGKAVADRENAVGVFWLDMENKDDWLLYLVDPMQERLLVRRAGSSIQSAAATIEAVAVIIKASAKALLQGQTLGLSPVEQANGDAIEWVRVEPESPGEHGKSEEEISSAEKEKQPQAPHVRVDMPPAGQTSPDREPSLIRLAIAYRGATFARETVWQNGLGLWAGWISWFGLYGGVGYTVIASEQMRLQSGEFSVGRHPVELFAGYRYRMGRFAVDGGLAAILDIMVRNAQTREDRFDTDEDQTRMVFGLLPRTRIEYAPVLTAAFFAGLGVSVFVNNFNYVEKTTRREILLSPQRFRIEIEAGVAVRL